ncbi:unnamed protein product [Calicophoron daubneyi]|uniref:Uncharacterized protein n=1 Tax=Calicophoron daubneyi TaxID=300641 RepID=A0AAV2TDH7_CALDB
MNMSNCNQNSLQLGCGLRFSQCNSDHSTQQNPVATTLLAFGHLTFYGMKRQFQNCRADHKVSIEFLGVYDKRETHRLSQEMFLGVLLDNEYHNCKPLLKWNFADVLHDIQFIS